MQPIIQVEDICVKSGNRFLLNKINWTVNKGEHWAVFGLNGSGKTTLLSIIAGFKSPTSGKLHVLGSSYSKETILKLRKKVGWVSSSFFDKYYKNESVLQIVLSGLTGTFNIDDTVTDADVCFAKALLCELHIEDKINYPFYFLSKGERQNVLIARALISRPEILLLDEPGTGLDVYAREHMMTTVRTLAEHGDTTILYVSHYPEEIQPFMNKTLLLKNGRVFANGNTDSIFTNETMSRFMDKDITVFKDENDGIRLSLNASSALHHLCYGEEITQ